MFPMTVSLTVSNATQFQALAAIVASDATQLPAKVEPKKIEKKEAEKAPTPPTTPPPVHEKVEASKVEFPDADPTTNKTLDDAKALTMKVVAAKGRDAAVELLAKFNVKVAAKLEAGQVDAFCAEAEAVLNG